MQNPLNRKKQIFKSNLTKAFALVNIFPTWTTDPKILSSFLKKLHPISTDKPLIRLGPNGDGGYLIPDDLLGISACFSPGVSSVSGFEKECANIGMKVFLADKSVDRPSEEHDLFHFSKQFIGAISSEDFVTLDDWVIGSLADQDSDLILQIDIEGYEYEVFLSTSKALMNRFRIIVAEFHRLDELWSQPFFDLASRSFEKILETHACVHIHPNNSGGFIKKAGLDIPNVMEFTFLRKDRINISLPQTTFPHPLDQNNSVHYPTLPLASCWISSRQGS